jgi:hypothetical protein
MPSYDSYDVHRTSVGARGEAVRLDDLNLDDYGRL